MSPLSYDCGKLCGALCCTCSNITDEDMGIYLYPGEEKLHSKNDKWLDWSGENAEDYDFPNSWQGKVYFVKCTTPPNCPRGKRPFQCRTFPLAPYIDQSGCFQLVYNYEILPYSCPLIDGDYRIEESFYKATFTVWTHLLRDPLIFDLVEYESRKWDQRMEEKY